jgi:hypothetical protein
MIAIRGQVLILLILQIISCTTIASNALNVSITHPEFTQLATQNAFAKKCPFITRKQGHKFFTDAIRDVIMLHVNLFSIDSFKVIAASMPFYFATRMLDEPVHRYFYCPSHHKNLRQLPHWCHETVRLGLALPISTFGLLGLFSSDPEWRQTGQVFLIGMPFVIFGKDVLKQIEIDASYRPWNEHFSCKKRALGGFPSGHMAEITYMIALYGMRFGLPVAIPLGIYGAALASVFVNCNRHYVSQMVAGAALGTMYAFAANKLIDSRLGRQGNLSCGYSKANGVTVNYSYKF